MDEYYMKRNAGLQDAGFDSASSDLPSLQSVVPDLAIMPLNPDWISTVFH